MNLIKKIYRKSIDHQLWIQQNSGFNQSNTDYKVLNKSIPAYVLVIVFIIIGIAIIGLIVSI